MFAHKERQGTGQTEESIPCPLYPVSTAGRRARPEMSTDAYQIVTDRIIAQLEQGVVPWQKPWSQFSREPQANAVSHKPYRGINVFLTACQTFQDHRWLTFNQAKQ